MVRNSQKLVRSLLHFSDFSLIPAGRNFSRSFRSSSAFSSKFEEVPSKCDVVIIGGGIMGSSTAFWLKQHSAGKDLEVVVLERDPKYTKASTVLSMGGVRQQFSLKENIQLSLFGADFLRRANEFLGVEGGAPVDVGYRPRGYLFLTTTPDGAELLHQNFLLQKELGSKTELLSRTKLKEKFPYMNVDDITLASNGVDNEGWFDPWSLLNGFKSKAASLGATYVTGEVVDFEYHNRPASPGFGPNVVTFRGAAGELRQLEFAHCVVAAGYESGRVSSLAGIGGGEGLLSCAVPVEPRKRYVYFVHSPAAPDDGFPMLIDSSGAYIRREGAPGCFLCGQSPAEEEEPPTDDLEVDFSFFESHVWPNLAHRVPHFENLKVRSAWGGYYDYNSFDQNGIIGTHPAFHNFHFATGFSGHGIQQGPAVGRALMELILHEQFTSIDLSRFGFHRLVAGTQILEQNIV